MEATDTELQPACHSNPHGTKEGSV